MCKFITTALPLALRSFAYALDDKDLHHPLTS